MEDTIKALISEIKGLNAYEIDADDNFEIDLSMDEDEIFDLFDALEDVTGIELLAKRKKYRTVRSLANYLDNCE